MKNLFIDLSTLEKKEFLAQAIKIYLSRSNNINFYIKGDQNDLLTLDSNTYKLVDDAPSDTDFKLEFSNEDFSNFDGSSTLYRFINFDKSTQTLFVVLNNKSINSETLDSIIENAENIYKVFLKQDNVPEIAFYNTPFSADDLIEALRIKDIKFTKNPLERISRIVLLDAQSGYHLFNTLEIYSKNIFKGKEKEKVSFSFLSKKVISFSRDNEQEDLNRLFNYYYFEEKENEPILVHIIQIKNLTSLFKIFSDLEDLNFINQ